MLAMKRETGGATIEFIEAVKKWPCIYDMKHVGFRDRFQTCKAWNAISSEFSENTISELQRRWRSLKDCYIKYKRSISVEQCAPTIKHYRKWRWAKYLRFLDDCSPVYPDGSLCGKSSKCKEMHVKQEPESDNNKDAPHFMEVYVESPNQSHKVEQIEMDSTDQLFQSYAKTFRTFTRKRQALLKLELAKLFSAAELEQLDEEKGD